MPTTRFASAAVKTASPDSDPNTTSNVELQKEQRNAAFKNRKKREVPKELTPKQQVMIQFIDNVTSIDKGHLLWSKAPEDSITFETIIERVYKLKYKDFASLQNDLDKLFSSSVHILYKSRNDLDALNKLYSYIANSIKLEASRFDEELEKSSAIEFTALFRPTTDGYAFTDAIVKDPTSGPVTNYPHNIYEAVIHESQPAANNEVPRLKDVVAPPPVYYPKILRHENKPVVPVNWLDFGAFSSFAPASDSNNANATYEGTYMGRSAKRLKRWQEKQHRTSEENPTEDMETNDEELNEAWLAKEGLDMTAIVAAMNKLPDNVEEELDRNSQLLEELIQYQYSRFSGGPTKWDAVDEKEVEIAKTLEKSMSDMLSKLPPNATTSTEVIENTMDRLPLLDPAYRGTLPPHKLFSFPTTEKAEVLPAYANVTPTYSKDNWRLVKVAPVPPKDMTGNFPSFPLTSMLEQQQLNFYQKPAFPVPQQVLPPQQLPQQPQQPQRMSIAANGVPYVNHQAQRR